MRNWVGLMATGSAIWGFLTDTRVTWASLSSVIERPTATDSTFACSGAGIATVVGIAAGAVTAAGAASATSTVSSFGFSAETGSLVTTASFIVSGLCPGSV